MATGQVRSDGSSSLIELSPELLLDITSIIYPIATSLHFPFTTCALHPLTSISIINIYRYQLRALAPIQATTTRCIELVYKSPASQSTR